MKVRLVAPPWGAPQITPEAEEAFALMADNVWRDACVRFYGQIVKPSATSPGRPRWPS